MAGRTCDWGSGRAGPDGPARGIPTGRGRREAGFSLVEVLVTIMIMSLSFVAILQAIAVSIRLSDLHRQQAEVGAVVVSALERVKETTKVACASKTQATYVAAAKGAATTEGWNASTVQITQVRYWDGTGYGTVCYDNLVSRLPLQQITVVVAHPRGRVTNTLTFVKGIG